jgi:phasin
MATAPKKAHAAPPIIDHVPAEVAAAEHAVAPTLAMPPEVAKMFAAPAASVTEMQDKVRTMIEKGIVETRAAYSKVKSAADETSTALESSYATAKTGVVAINVKALEALRASADANFDFVKSIFGVKSVADYVALHSEFARKQIETMTGNTKELSELAKKVATESVEPIKAQVAKTFKAPV